MINHSLKKMACATSLLLLLGNYAFAQPNIVIATSCLAEKASLSKKAIGTYQNFQLLQLNKNDLEQLINAKLKHQKTCGGFKDVTINWQSSQKYASTFLKTSLQKKTKLAKIDYQIRYQKEVTQLFNQLIPNTMWINLTTLTNF